MRLFSLTAGALTAGALALLLAGCSGQPTEAQLRPPEGWREAVNASAHAAADQARRASQELLRRSPAVVAPPLAQGIRFSRHEALREDVREMPESMRRTLDPYFDAEILDNIRWTLAGRDLGVGSLLARWYYEEGAVTLDDVIVFSDEAVARNVWLWAHELGHVEQYRRYGVDGFAARYAADWRALEAEASARAFAVTADIRARKAARPSPVAVLVEQVEEMLNPPDGEEAPPQAEESPADASDPEAAPAETPDAPDAPAPAS